MELLVKYILHKNKTFLSKKYCLNEIVTCRLDSKKWSKSFGGDFDLENL